MNHNKLISYWTVLCMLMILVPSGYAKPRVMVMRWDDGEEIRMCGHYGDGVFDDDQPSHIRKKRQSAYMWTKRHLSYRVITYDWELATDEADLAFAGAFKVWSDVSPLTFTSSDCDTVDLEIGFLADSHDDGYTFTSTSAIAHAFVPCGVPLCGDLHFFEELTWANGVTSDGYNLVFVAAHEIGHALGLIHSANPDALMYSGYKNTHPVLVTDDIAQIEAMYGTQIAPASSLSDNALPDTCGRTTQTVQPTTTPTTTPLTTTATTTTTTTTTTTQADTATTKAYVPTTNRIRGFGSGLGAGGETGTMVTDNVDVESNVTKRKGDKVKTRGRKVKKGKTFEDEGTPGVEKKVRFKGKRYKVKHREGGGLVAEDDTDTQ